MLKLPSALYKMAAETLDLHTVAPKFQTGIMPKSQQTMAAKPPDAMLKSQIFKDASLDIEEVEDALSGEKQNVRGAWSKEAEETPKIKVALARQMKQINEQIHQQVTGKVLSHFSAQRDDNNNSTEVVVMQVQSGQNKQKSQWQQVKSHFIKSKTLLKKKLDERDPPRNEMVKLQQFFLLLLFLSQWKRDSSSF